MSENNTNVPKIRFPGFTDGWERHSLSNVGDFERISVDPQATPDKSFVEYSMPSYDNGRNPETIFGHSMQSMRIKISGDVLLINKLNVRQRRIWFVKDTPINAVASSEFMPFTSTKIDLAFLEQLMLSDKTTRDLESISSGTSNSQKRITPSDVLKYRIKLPVDRLEQEKIGSFFKNIDNLINLHQRKLKHLHDKKKSLLQKMFPKNGSNVPEIRFPGFTDAWEQRKLGEILNINSGRDYKHLNKGDIPVYGTGGYMLSVNESLSDIDAVGIGRKGTIDKPQLLKAPFWTVDTLFYMTPKDSNNLLFCFSLVGNIRWKKYDESTGVPSLSKATIVKVNIRKPIPKEQGKIGEFFNQLDNTITLHQRKLKHVQELKKSLLQQMFV